ncbi:hypothetical protein CFP56_004861 [Quercus suber]|uniref:Uncharacterized protein n=1 Tax=Quercus suber TaxID=58331 RepID=A0AAW0M7P7_QUESU
MVLDPILRALINGYKSFGTFLLCSELGCSCFEDLQTILELLMAAYSGSPENQDPNKKTLPLRASIITKLAAIGLVRSQCQAYFNSSSSSTTLPPKFCKR